MPAPEIARLLAAEALVRNLVLRLAGGTMLRRRYNWLYDWRAPAIAAAAIDIDPPRRATEKGRETA